LSSGKLSRKNDVQLLVNVEGQAAALEDPGNAAELEREPVDRLPGDAEERKAD
jgi:hypothetical protein